MILRFFTIRGWTALLPLVLLAGFAAPAAAQSVRETVTDQTSVLQRFTPPPSRPPSIGVTIDTGVAGVAPEALGDVRITLRRVEIEGAATLDPALFAPLYAGIVGRQIPLTEIKGVLDGIERIYREHDYYALALVPPQDLSGGVVRIVVYESYIREVSIEGDIAHVRNLEKRLQPYIDRMVEMRPVRISRLMRYALLMTDLAGLTINAEFSRIADEPGAGRLVLKIDFDPSRFGARLDNFASPDVGPLELAGTARFNNAFGLFESTDGLIVTNPAAPNQLVVARLAQHVPLGPSGFATGYAFTQVWSNPEGDDDVHAETSQANVYLDYAVLRAQERNIIAHLGLWGTDISVDVNGDPAVRQRKRWASLGATYDDTFLGIAALTDVRLSHGLDVFDASGEDNDFSFANAEGTLSKDVTDTISTTLFYTGQYAFTDLPSAANFSLGGETYGRAFDAGAIAGQSGYAVAFEASKSLDLGIDWLTGFALFGFIDYGAVWNAPGRGGYDYAALGSAGGGVRTRLGSHAMASAWVAVPYKDEPELGAEGTTVRFSAGVQF